MSFENLAMQTPAKKELPTIELSQEDFNLLHTSFGKGGEDVTELMAQKGITYDSGDIIAVIDGKRRMFTTKKSDFFTELAPETVEEKHGSEVRNSIDSI